MSMMIGFANEAAAAAAEHGAEHGGLGAEFWVAVAFVVVVGLLLRLGVHKVIAQALDARSAKIAAELDEARSLREEAQSALAHLQRRQREASAEAKEIIAHAKSEAEILKQEMAANVETLITRRTGFAEDRIRQAEAAALTQVRAAAVDAAVRAAQAVIEARLAGPEGAKLVDGAIAELDRKLH